MSEHAPKPQGRKPAVYRIQIEGIPGEDWPDWLNGMQVSITRGQAEAPVTTLSGFVTDQAALRGILCRLWDQNLTVLSVARLEPGWAEKEGKNEQHNPVF
jgi:hypothetical protein